MKIKKVKFSKEFQSIYGNCWISLQAKPDPGETEEEVFDKIAEKINNWGGRISGDNPVGKTVQAEKNPAQDRAEIMRQDILNSKDLSELETFATFVSANPQFSDTYNKRLNELTNR